MCYTGLEPVGAKGQAEGAGIDVVGLGAGAGAGAVVVTGAAIRASGFLAAVFFRAGFFLAAFFFADFFADFFLAAFLLADFLAAAFLFAVFFFVAFFFFLDAFFFFAALRFAAIATSYMKINNRVLLSTTTTLAAVRATRTGAFRGLQQFLNAQYVVWPCSPNPGTTSQDPDRSLLPNTTRPLLC